MQSQQSKRTQYSAINRIIVLNHLEEFKSIEAFQEHLYQFVFERLQDVALHILYGIKNKKDRLP